MIKLTSVCKEHNQHSVLRGLSAEFSSAKSYSICGHSGSGKTTLLNILASFWPPTSGQVVVDSTDITLLTEKEKCQFRRSTIGYVYQSHFLIPTLSAHNNIKLVALLQEDGYDTADNRTNEILDRVGLYSKRSRFPHELSGGEQQRVGIARAMVNQQKVLLADEPTGNLDQSTGKQILNLLLEASAETNSSVIIATHSKAVAEGTNETLFIKDGAFVNDVEYVTW